MWTKQSSKRMGITGAVAMAAMAGAASPALAGHGREPSRPVLVEACAAEQAAGRMQIGARAYTIGAQFPKYDLIEAFRCAGFSARTDGKSVIVNAPRRRPAMAWTSGLYNAEFVISGNCITITLDAAACDCDDQGRRHSHADRGSRGDGWNSAHSFGWDYGRGRAGRGSRFGLRRSAPFAINPAFKIGRLCVAPRLRARIGDLGVSIGRR